MKAPKTVYVCSECDYQSPRWLGRCPSCQSWNSFVEETYAPVTAAAPAAARSQGHAAERAVRFSDMDATENERLVTGIGELDRVLGGGLVTGSVVLLAGEPGIGKSTLLTQLCALVGPRASVLYVSGEESKRQLKIRADRLACDCVDIFVLTETNMQTVLSEYDRIKPRLLIVDSIQTMYSPNVNSSPGSITQVREGASQLIARAKEEGCIVILVGHVNKEGGIAGPKILEHMVDAVLYFEGERSQSHRIIRAIKNRYGSTNEIGVFEMTDSGLCEIENPSEMLLSGRPVGVSGSCAVCVMEGTRPLIAEIQALVTPTAFPSPRRTADGLDYNRMCLLLAVLEKRLGLRFSGCDVYLNVVGGLSLYEPATDAATALALISSLKDIPVEQELIVMGELGLSGELRSVPGVDQRAREAYRLGFTKIAVPRRANAKRPLEIKGAEIIKLGGIYDMLSLLSKNDKKKEKQL